MTQDNLSAISNLRWKKNTGKYAVGEFLYLGRWKVGGSHYDALRSKAAHDKWQAITRLPGLKRCIGHFANEEEAKDAVEQAVKFWLKNAEES